MKWIGLTGCMGCGKSTVAEILKEDHQFTVVSADEVALSLLKDDLELQAYILEKFKIQPPAMEKSLEAKKEFRRYRTEISAKVFKNPDLLKEYELFFHPKIKAKVQLLKTAISKNHKLAFYDVPLLFEKNMQAEFDYILGVFADQKIQYDRIEKRNHWTKDQIQDRLKHQVSNLEKIKKCDYVIMNNSDLNSLKAEVAKFVKLISEPNSKF